MWDDDNSSEDLPDHLTKESREGLHDVSTAELFSLHIQGLTKVNLEPPAPRDQMKKQVKDAFRDTISCYLTSDWPKGESLSPNEVAQAFRDALTEEASWYQKQAQRCEEFRRSVEGITFGNITYVPEEEEGAA